MDFEAIEASDNRLLFVGNLANPGGWRPCLKPGKHVIDLIGRTLYKRFDHTVIKVPNPAAHTKLMSAAYSGCAVPYPLNAPGHSHNEGFERVIVIQPLHG